MKNTKRTHRIRIQTITKIAVLAAISTVIMLFEIPLPFAPSFYKLDLSEAVILMGGFALGPIPAAIIELIKNLLNILLNGTSTNYIGELANFVTGCSFVIPAAILYKYRKNRTGAIRSLILGTVSLSVIGSLFNYYFLVPAFSRLYNIPLDSIVAMGSAVNPLVSDLRTLIVFAVVPFNLIKGVLCSLLNLFLYKRLSPLLHK